MLPSLLALLLGASAASYQLAVNKHAALTPDDRQRIAFEFNRYFVGGTLALQPADLELKPVALSGQNQGGPAVKAVARAPKTVRTSSQKLAVPLEYTYISQGFNAYVHPGLDFVAPYGTPIVSAAAGCVKSVGGGYNGGYGNLVILDHGNGATTRYAHLQRFAAAITQGACIDAGALIGYVGLTGRTTGAHLHFELRQNGLPVQPIF